MIPHPQTVHIVRELQRHELLAAMHGQEGIDSRARGDRLPRRHGVAAIRRLVAVLAAVAAPKLSRPRERGAVARFVRVERAAVPAPARWVLLR